jgi:hypothetical protein
MDISALHASSSIMIAAPPEKVYAFIADMPRIGEVSPQCTGGRWEGDGRSVGATFIGSNTRKDFTWKARMRIVVDDPPREFAWENLGDHRVPLVADAVPLVRWGYKFLPVDGGTQVVEDWRIVNSYPQLEQLPESRFAELPAMMLDGMETTLANLKGLLET